MQKQVSNQGGRHRKSKATLGEIGKSRKTGKEAGTQSKESQGKAGKSMQAGIKNQVGRQKQAGRQM